MTTIKLNNREYVFVPVPDDANRLSMSSIGNLHYDYDHSHDGTYQMHIVDLFDTSLCFIATTTDITEEQAGEIVDDMDREWLYRDYTAPHIHHAYTTALYSFKSLLQHHSLTGRYAIIEKI